MGLTCSRTCRTAASLRRPASQARPSSIASIGGQAARGFIDAHHGKANIGDDAVLYGQHRTGTRKGEIPRASVRSPRSPSLERCGQDLGR